MNLNRSSAWIVGLLAVAGAASAAAQNIGESRFGNTARWQQMMNQRDGIFFVGKVKMAGGPLPWEAIPVTVTCQGTQRYNALTDPTGDFRIEAPLKDHDVAAKPGKRELDPASLMGCTVAASLLGFVSSKITIASKSMLDSPDIGTITLHPDEAALGSSVSMTTAAAPKDALKEFDKARAEDEKKNLEGARRDLQKAVEIDPQFAEAWYHLGRLQEMEHPQEARASYEKAIAADPKFAPACEHLANVAAAAKDWKAVVDATAHGLKLNPSGTPQLLYYSALGNYNAGALEIAEERARASLAMDPSHVVPITEQLLAVMLVRRQQYAEALQHLRNSLTYAAPGPNADLMKQQVAQLEKMVPADAKQ